MKVAIVRKKGGVLVLYFLLIACSNRPELSNAQFSSNKLKGQLQATLELLPVKINGKWGFIDYKSNIVISPVYQWAERFNGDFAAVKMNDEWGFIDKKGNHTVIPKKLMIPNIQDGLELYGNIDIEDEYSYREMTGKSVITIKADFARPFSEGLAAIRRHNMWGYIDKTGKLAIPLQFEDADMFSEGLAFVWGPKNKRGYIDKTGQTIISRPEGGGRRFSEGLAGVYENGALGYINKKGEMVIKPHFKDSSEQDMNDDWEFYDGMALIRIDYNKVNYINREGHYIGSTIYEDGAKYSEGLASVKLNGKWGYIDKLGRIVIEPQYQNAYDFITGVAQVWTGDGKVGYIDKNGKYIWAPTK